MRKRIPSILECGRIRDGEWGTSKSDGRNGAFEIRSPVSMSAVLRIIVSDNSDDIAKGWEHASISVVDRTPTWREMSYVKDLLWDETETVIQFHPPRSEYVNHHPHCLHLWKPPFAVPLPPTVLVGPKGDGLMSAIVNNLLGSVRR